MHPDNKGVNFVFTYYGQLDHLYHHCEFFKHFATKYPQYKHLFNVCFVNDGFREDNSFENMLGLYKNYFNITAFTVKQDIGFNSHGCRNLAMLQSKYFWNLLLDMDCYMNAYFCKTVIGKHDELDPNIFYCFKVKKTKYNPKKYDYFDDKNLLKIVAHPNVFLINKPCFWSSGGYDIEFAGQRYGDKEFFLAIDKDKYTHELLYDSNNNPLGLKIQTPLRTSSYINSSQQKGPYLQKTLDFVTKRIDNKIRKLRKRIICFNWQQVV